jgi:hypothetical protein
MRSLIRLLPGTSGGDAGPDDRGRSERDDRVDPVVKGREQEGGFGTEGAAKHDEASAGFSQQV